MLQRPFRLEQTWLPDGTLVWHDGPWVLLDVQPTLGEYRQFDGWWREPTAEEEGRARSVTTQRNHDRPSDA